MSNCITSKFTLSWGMVIKGFFINVLFELQLITEYGPEEKELIYDYCTGEYKVNNNN